MRLQSLTSLLKLETHPYRGATANRKLSSTSKLVFSFATCLWRPPMMNSSTLSRKSAPSSTARSLEITCHNPSRRAWSTSLPKSKLRLLSQLCTKRPSQVVKTRSHYLCRPTESSRRCKSDSQLSSRKLISASTVFLTTSTRTRFA